MFGRAGASFDRPRPELTGPSLAVYEYAVLQGRLELDAACRDLPLEPGQIATACRELRELRLLAAADSSDLLVPLHPDLARSVLNEPLAAEIKACEQLVEENNRRLQRISEALAGAAMRSGDGAGIRVVFDPAEVRREVDAALLSCAEELITLQPGRGNGHQHLATSVTTDVSLLERGVARRLLFQHTARAHLGVRSHVRQISGHGGEARTTSASFEALCLVDRRVAFLPVDPAGNPQGTAVVTHPAVVLFLHRMAEHLWGGSMPFDERDARYDEATDEMKVTLLRLMASGLKDEAIANRLGMATRTCRRYMSAIMDELGATSRFEAGVKIAQMGILSSVHDMEPVARADDHPLW